MTTMTDDDARPTTWLDLPDAPAIPGLRFRRSRRDDADYAAIAEVYGASNAADDIPYAPSGANLREDMEDQPAFDPDVDFVIAEVDGVQVGNTGVDRRPAWRDGRLRDVGPRHPGLATAGHRPHAAGGEPGPRPGAGRGRRSRPTRGRRSPARSPRRPEVGHRRILEDAGFETVRYFFDMARDLTEVEVAPLPDGLELRPVTPDQHRTIWEADTEAFRDHWEARQPEEADFGHLFAKADFDPALWVVAWDGDQVAGVRAALDLEGRERDPRPAARLAGAHQRPSPVARPRPGPRPDDRGAAPAARGGHDRGHARGRCRQPDRRARAVRVDGLHGRHPGRSRAPAACARPGRAGPRWDDGRTWKEVRPCAPISSWPTRR